MRSLNTAFDARLVARQLYERFVNLPVREEFDALAV